VVKKTMKTILIAAMTVNGYIARYPGEFPNYWSKEDYDFFIRLTRKAGNVVMGRKTWDAIPPKRKPLAGRFALIFTKENRSQENMPGKYEYCKMSPEKAIEYLRTKGFKTICIIGGSEINSLFLKEGLVNELYLTIEPMLFGKGVPLFREEDIDINLQLLSMKQLNQSSFNLHYKVL